MGEFIKLFRNVLSPESDWATFVRKLIGLSIAGATAVIGLHYYTQYTLRDVGEPTVEVALDRSPNKQKQVRRLIETILNLHPHVESVWVYSWPDALNLVPIMYVGDSKNPLPSSVFSTRDAGDLGYFLFGTCRELNRGFENLTCPINGFEDSWGVLVVVLDAPIDTNTMSEIEGLSRRVGLTIYTNRSHESNID